LVTALFTVYSKPHLKISAPIFKLGKEAMASLLGSKEVFYL